MKITIYVLKCHYKPAIYLFKITTNKVVVSEFLDLFEHHNAIVLLKLIMF